MWPARQMAQVARHLCNFVDWRVTCHWAAVGSAVVVECAAGERSSVDYAVDYSGAATRTPSDRATGTTPARSALPRPAESTLWVGGNCGAATWRAGGLSSWASTATCCVATPLNTRADWRAVIGAPVLIMEASRSGTPRAFDGGRAQSRYLRVSGKRAASAVVPDNYPAGALVWHASRCYARYPTGDLSALCVLLLSMF